MSAQIIAMAGQPAQLVDVSKKTVVSVMIDRVLDRALAEP